MEEQEQCHICKKRINLLRTNRRCSTCGKRLDNLTCYEMGTCHSICKKCYSLLTDKILHAVDKIIEEERLGGARILNDQWVVNCKMSEKPSTLSPE